MLPEDPWPLPEELEPEAPDAVVPAAPDSELGAGLVLPVDPGCDDDWSGEDFDEVLEPAEPVVSANATAGV